MTATHPRRHMITHAAPIAAARNRPQVCVHSSKVSQTPSHATCRRSPRTKASANDADASTDSRTTSEYIRVSCA